MKSRDWMEFAETLGHDPTLPIAPATIPANMTSQSPPVQISFMFVSAEHQTENASVCEANELLTKMIQAMGLNRNHVCVASLSKTQLAHDHSPDLQKQINQIKPKYLIALGKPAVDYLLSTKKDLSLLRGKMHTEHHWLDDDHQKEPIKIIATFHPEELIRNPELKKPAWEDLKFVMQDAGLMERTHK